MAARVCRTARIGRHRVTLQPRERTLTDAEIEAAVAKIVAEVGKKTGATLRLMERWASAFGSGSRRRRPAPTPTPARSIEDPLAYNACLAKQGPRAAGTRPASPQEESSGPVRRVRQGRQQLEFSVGD